MNNEVDSTGKQRSAIYDAFTEGHRAKQSETCPYDPSSTLASAWYMGRGTSTAIVEAKRQNADLRQRLEDTEALLIIARATQEQMQDELAAKDAERQRYATALHFMLGFLHEDVDNIETARQIITLARKTVKQALGDE